MTAVYHEITSRLAIAGAPSPDPTVAFSRAVALGDHNALSVEAWLAATDGTVSCKIHLEGSNDLCNWTAITDFTVATVPSHTVSSATDILPWAYVRLRYAITSASSDRVLIRAGIEAIQKG